MATFSCWANELKYASGSSWTSGKARQGVYSSTRYEGAIKFGDLENLQTGNIDITQIQLRFDFGQAGGASSKYLTFYKSNSNTISGSISSMRGASIGSLYISEAYNRTEIVTFNSTTNTALFNTLKSYFMAGNRVLIIYVPTTRGTYAGGYCYDYLGITAAAINITYDYLQSDGSLQSTSVAAGTAAKLNITAYNEAYSHKVTWKFGSYSNTQTILYKTGTVNVTAKVVDTRGRMATKTTSFYIYPYAAPYFTSVEGYRCNSSGTRDDANGTYAYVKAGFNCYSVNSKNSVTGSMTLKQVGGSYTTSKTITSGTANIVGAGNLASDATYQATLTLTDTVGSVTTYVVEIPSAAYMIHVKKGGRAVGFGMAAGEDNTVSFGWPVKLATPLEVEQGGTGGNSQATACAALGAVKKAGDTMTGDLNIQTSLYPSLKLKPTYNSTTNQTVFEGSYAGASSFASWEDSSGQNRRMLEVRTAKYAASLDNAVLLRTCVNNSWAAYRVFHAGMATPVPVANGGTGGANAKAALTNLGIFYADTLPSSGTDGQICLVPV